MLLRSEVAKHNTKQSCWVIIRDQVYNMTNYLNDHPGGPAAILRSGGKDATEEFEALHPEGTLEKNVPKENCLGPVEPTTAADDTLPPPPSRPAQSIQLPTRVTTTQQAAPRRLPLPVCTSLHDIETQGRLALSHRAWTYFSSAAEDYSAMQADIKDWTRIRFRPRVLRNVAKVDMRRSIMGWDSALPFFIAPTALVKLAHPEGEMSLLKGASRRRIPYCVSTLASVGHEELCGAWKGQYADRTCLFFQLYVAKEEKKARETIRMAKRLGYKALAVTVDTPVVGKREDDERDKLLADYDAGIITSQDLGEDDPGVEKPILRGVNSSTLDWNDLRWIKEEWGDQGPLVIKGIGAAEDAKLAHSMGFKYLYLSNHGGRQLASGPSAISTLLEIRHFFPEVLRDCEVYLDGGVRRGSDIVKAICLGATAVGMGRPFLYGLGAFGVDGVVKVIQILSDEIETTMRLLGVTKLSDLRPEMVNASRLEQYLVPRLGDDGVIRSRL